MTGAIGYQGWVRRSETWVNDVRFQVFGFPVTVQPAFGLLLAVYLLVGLQAQRSIASIAAFGAIVFVSILVHELGHAFVARRLGMRVGGIFIHGFGGHVTHSGGQAHHRLAVSLAGPGAGLSLGLPALAAACLGAWPAPLHSFLFDVIWVNVGWSLMNLLPMLPLDGGKAFGALLELWWGPARGWAVTASVGVAVGSGLLGLGLYLDETFLMLLGGFCAYHSYQARLSLRSA